MTVSRALHGLARARAVRATAVRVAALALVVAALAATVAPPSVVGHAHADDAIESSPASTAAAAVSDGATTTTLVASEAPTPGAAAGRPRVGPLDSGVGSRGGSGVWWLFGLGAAQVAILFVMTRRSRARLSTHEAAP
jgi:hypothetical protein